MMMLLYCTLSLFLVLRLSECDLIIHHDCDKPAGTLVNGQSFTFSDIVQSKIKKTTARLFALHEEMDLLTADAKPLRGNEGLRTTVLRLFNALSNFQKVTESTQAVAESIENIRATQGYSPSLTHTDTVSLLQGLLYGSTLH